MKFVLAALIVVGTAGAAMAQTASAPASSTSGMTEAQARYAADAAGYAPASNMTKDQKGDWLGGNESKGNFMVSPDGKVTAR